MLSQPSSIFQSSIYVTKVFILNSAQNFYINYMCISPFHYHVILLKSKSSSLTRDF